MSNWVWVLIITFVVVAIYAIFEVRDIWKRLK